MAELRKRERELGIEPDYEVDAFMKAASRPPKRESIATDYVLHFLGLDVRPLCPSSCASACAGWPDCRPGSQANVKLCVS